MLRAIAAVLALAMGGDAIVQLTAPLWWYGAVPGVIATGAFNAHFVRDVGAAYLVAAIGLASFARAPETARPAVAMSAAFLSLHAAIHIFDAACGTRPLQDVIRDAGGVYLPALVTLTLALTPARAVPSKELAPC